MGLRCLAIAEGGRRGNREISRMMAEKAIVAATAQVAAAAAWSRGPAGVGDAMFRAYRSAVRANARRLGERK
jgi:hypothetical protein